MLTKINIVGHYDSLKKSEIFVFSHLTNLRQYVRIAL